MDEGWLMDIVERVEQLARTDIFKDLRTEDLVAIATLTLQRVWDADDALLPEGIPESTMHLIVEGRIGGKKAGPGDLRGGAGLQHGKLQLSR